MPTYLFPLQTALFAFFHDTLNVMLYTFKSPAAGNLIMLQPDGDRTLEIIGKGDSPKGVILPEQMLAAIAALESAAAVEGGASDAVSLRQHVTPFIEMLQRCHRAGKDIVWGV